MQLEPVSDVDVYFKDPRRRILWRDGYFCSSPDGKVLTLWGAGHADVSGLDSLFEIFRAVERAGLGPRRQLVVLRHMKSVSPAALQKFVHYHRTVTTYLAGVTREAVIRPDGVVGVFAEGFYRAVHTPAEGRVFTDLSAALAFVGIDDDDWVAAATAAELSLLRRDREGLEGLDALWSDRWMRLGVAAAAAALGVTPRTLQRRLRESGTTFEERRLRASIEHAEQLLLDGWDVKKVGATLGFTSASAFTAAFRRVRGAAPTRWRSDAAESAVADATNTIARATS